MFLLFSLCLCIETCPVFALSNGNFNVDFLAVWLIPNNGHQAPFQNSTFYQNDLFNGQTIQIGGNLRVTAGELISFEILVNGQRQGNPIYPQPMGQGLYSWRGEIQMQPEKITQVNLRMTVRNSANGQIVPVDYAQAPVELTYGSEAFEAQITEAQLVLNNNNNVNFESRSLAESDLYGGRQLIARGKIQVKKGELFRLDLVTSNTGNTVLMKGQYPRPMTAGVYDWNGSIHIEPAHKEKVFLRMTAFNPRTQSEGVSSDYPSTPIELNYAAGPPVVELANVEFLLKDGQNRARHVPFQSLTLKDADVFDNTITLTGTLKVKQGKLTQFLLHQNMGSGPVNLWNGKSLPLTIGEYGWQNSIIVEKGRSYSLFFSLAGIDPNTQREGAPFNLPQNSVVIDYPSATVQAGAFSAEFTGLTLQLPEGAKKNFADIPADGLLVETDYPIPIGVTASWKVNKGFLGLVMVSVDGGKNWTNFSTEPKATSGTQTLPFHLGDNPDIVFQFVGQDVDSAGRPTGSTQFVPDKRHALLAIRKPVIVPFNATFTNLSVKVGDSPEKKIEDAAETHLFSDKQVNVDVSASWKLGKGMFQNVEVSSDGGRTWSQFFWKVGNTNGKQTFTIPSRSSAAFMLRFVGYDTLKGNPGGNIVYLPDNRRAMVANHSTEITPFNVNFGEPTLSVPVLNKAVEFSSIPAAGMTIESGIDISVNVETTWSIAGTAAHVFASKDGGKNWQGVTVRADGYGSADFKLKPGE